MISTFAPEADIGAARAIRELVRVERLVSLLPLVVSRSDMFSARRSVGCVTRQPHCARWRTDISAPFMHPLPETRRALGYGSGLLSCRRDAFRGSGPRPLRAAERTSQREPKSDMFEHTFK